jgi:hypothetical protein
MPKRPEWSYNMSADKLEEQERKVSLLPPLNEFSKII